MNHYQYKIVKDIETFSSLKDEWNRLAGNEFFHQWSWMFHWWKNFQYRGDLSLVLIYHRNEFASEEKEMHSGQLVAIAPWFISSSISQGKTVQNLTSGETCSDYQSLLVDPDHRCGVVELLSDLICDLVEEGPFSDVDLFQIEGHRQQDPVVNKLMWAVEQKGGQAASEEIGATWRAKLCDSWSEFQQKIRSSFRRKTRKAEKRLRSDEFRFQSTSTEEEFLKAWPTFVQLHQKRRQFLGEDGCFADQTFESFLKDACLDLVKIQRARLNMVFHQETPIAVTLELLSDGEVWMYQSGVDTDRLSLEPGHLVFTGSMMQAIDNQNKVFDFLRGDEPYKAKWNAERHQVLTTKFIPNRLFAKCRFQIWQTKNQIKRWTKAIVPSEKKVKNK